MRCCARSVHTVDYRPNLGIFSYITQILRLPPGNNELYRTDLPGNIYIIEWGYSIYSTCAGIEFQWSYLFTLLQVVGP